MGYEHTKETKDSTQLFFLANPSTIKHIQQPNQSINSNILNFFASLTYMKTARKLLKLLFQIKNHY